MILEILGAQLSDQLMDLSTRQEIERQQLA
jgi:hypothetical protein